MKLRLHGIECQVTTLGPGKRYVLWVQGCRRRCKGCISPETWDMEGGYEDTTERLAEEIVNFTQDGLTISGGEPFLQAEALVDLIKRIKEKRDLGVIIYTGNTLEELKEMKEKSVYELLSLCDLLIDGVYEDDKNDGRNLRGSSNQKVIVLTERYIEEAKTYGTLPARVEFFVHENMTRMVGIPSKEMLDRVKKIIV